MSPYLLRSDACQRMGKMSRDPMSLLSHIDRPYPGTGTQVQDTRRSVIRCQRRSV